ncbi:hypothetical protein [Chryseobacterium sp.]|uniref:hypothetical protein n=1 Tax=Chryseobacterium sp. TaxID=1871047 RepID=UPI00289E6A73|nr:hypothetical protein [Chryseobacterium sp.]
MNISKLLKQPISKMPVSASFINAAKIQAKPLIKPLTGPDNYDDKDRDEVQKWLVFCAIGTTIVDTGTKMLKNKGLIHSRDGIFDMINAFKQLNKHFTGNDNFDKKEIEIDDFIFNFLT